MKTTVIRGGEIINEGKRLKADVLLKGERIEGIYPDGYAGKADLEIDAQGKWIIPGVIDDQVHFREPGLTHKAEIATESRAAVAGGITSFMEMPNTFPNTTTQPELEKKFQRAEAVSPANFSFFFGATNENLEEVLKTDKRNVCGIKVFMGSSTGNMLVDNEAVLRELFSKSEMLIATHCEDEATIRANTEKYKAKYGEDVPMECHPEIRSEEACYLSSSMAVKLAKETNARLHILHISTGKELELFDNTLPLAEKRITSEACTHHLWFSKEDYAKKGPWIKWNPAVKNASDRDAIWEGVNADLIDVLATDHAPHTMEEKENSYFNAPSGGPLVQHHLPAVLEKVKEGKITLEKAVEKMSHAPAICFQIEERGFIRPGYFADLVMVDPNSSWTVEKSNVLSKCGWSPFEGVTFSHEVKTTWVNGNIVYQNGSLVETAPRGKRLTFDR
ncbi:MAG: dihydroorotase [Luteibaculaceae bacterium]|jgi:dihydroorotase